MVTWVFFLLWPLIASAISLLLHANLIASTMLYLIISILYLSVLNWRISAKLFLVSLIGTPLGIISDYVMEVTHGWVPPYSLFGNFRLFGAVVPDLVIWFVAYTFLVGLFYEVVVRKNTILQIDRLKTSFLFMLLCALFDVFLFLHYVYPSLLQIDYFYLKFGLICVVVPLVIVWTMKRALGKDIVRLLAYFTYFSLPYELVGLYLHQWEFPGKNQYLYLFHLGVFVFPIEELLFWIILGSGGVIAFYELLIRKD